jgi:hypothetical protein
VGVVTQSRLPVLSRNGTKDEEGLGFGDPPAEMVPRRKGRGGRKLDCTESTTDSVRCPVQSV